MMSAPIAFVIMPFSRELDVVYERLIQPALRGYNVIRADDRLDERGILEKIVTGIRDAELVIADLTDANPNVMYELGVAHALGKPTVMIAQSMLMLPFDVRSYPVHEYSTHFARAAELATTLSELAERHRVGLLLFSNPVTDFIPELAAAPLPQRTLENYTIDDCNRDIEAATEGLRSFTESYERASKEFSLGMSSAVPMIGVIATCQPELEENAALGTVANILRTHALAIDSLVAPLHEVWERYGRAMLWLTELDQIVEIDTEHRTFLASGARETDAVLNGMIANIADVRAANNRTPQVTGNLTHAVESVHMAQTSLLNAIMTGKAYLARIVSGFEHGF